MQPFKNVYQNHCLLIIKMVLLTWAITKGMSYALFTAHRPFPLVPVHDLLLQLPSMLHLVLYVVSLAGMLLFLVLPKKWIGWLVLLAELASCMLDQNRWQPLEYQFLFMLAAWLIFQKQKFLFAAWQIMLVGIYFFSGLSKLQPAFIHDIWNGLLLRNWLGVYTTNQNVFRLGYLLPVIEIAAALLLCTRWRNWAIALLVAMHLLILLLFGPLGLNRNEVIWPWNMVMIALLFSLFYRRSFAVERAFFRRPFSWLVVCCFCLLPFLRLAGRWDHYLSFTMYSGGITQLYICTNDLATLQKMSPYLGTTRNGMIPCNFPVSAYHWGMQAMKHAPYPQERVFRAIARQWKKQYPGVEVKFYLFTSGFRPSVREMVVTL